MKNEILDYLNKYLEYEFNKNEKAINKVNTYFAKINKLNKLKKITSDDQDDLIECMCAYGDYILYVISNCPTLEIHLRKIMKNKRPKAQNKPVETQTQTYVIGFQPDDETATDEEFDDDLSVRC